MIIHDKPIPYIIEIRSNIELIRVEPRRIKLWEDDAYDLALTVYYIEAERYEDIINNNYDTYALQPPEGAFAWWVSIGDDSYGFYEFESLQFIQGFISICNAFNVDFRDAILGPPFTYDVDLGKQTFYSIEGYDIAPIPITKNAIPMGTFNSELYPELYEDDPYIMD